MHKYVQRLGSHTLGIRRRLAQRQGGALTWIIGDHLGSSSVTADADGNNPVTQLYAAWGTVRWSSGSLPVKYTYTGQYSHVTEFGLLFYQARWYDPALGRWGQADTLIPGGQGVTAWDRYAGMNNNPMRYRDPSGHYVCEDSNSCSHNQYHRYSSDQLLNLHLANYGVTLEGNWTSHDKWSISLGISAVGQKIGSVTGQSGADAFRGIYNNMTFEQVTYPCAEGCWGRSISSQDIRIYGPASGKLDPRLVVHELGHSFNASMVNQNGEESSPYYLLELKWNSDPNFPRRTNEHTGFAGGFPGWQQSESDASSEEFADMFIGWTYDTWEDHPAGVSRANWVATQMPLIINNTLP